MTLQRLDLQFYSFFAVVLCGAALGLLFDLLRAVRYHFRPNRWLGALGDLLFWAIATVALSGALFYGNWGEIRFYVLVGLLLGIGLYYWLASPVILHLAGLIIAVFEWFINLCITLVHRLVWAPLMALAGVLWGAVLILLRWSSALGTGLWQGVGQLLGWTWRPLIGPYRCFRLHYLLTKRRVKRRLRLWLLGPSRPRRR